MEAPGLDPVPALTLTQDGRSTTKEIELAEQRKQRSAAPSRSVRDICREHDVAEALYYSWRDKILEGGKAAEGEAARRRCSTRSSP